MQDDVLGSWCLGRWTAHAAHDGAGRIVHGVGKNSVSRCAIGVRLFSGVHEELAKNKNFVTRAGTSLGKEQPEPVQARS